MIDRFWEAEKQENMEHFRQNHTGKHSGSNLMHLVCKQPKQTESKKIWKST